MMGAAAEIRDIARRLVACEAARAGRPFATPADAARACDRLRGTISRLAGVRGFHSLLSRALSLAKADSPALADATVRADGALEGLESLRSGDGAGVEVVTQLLALLATLIGEPLTLRLLQDTWPETPASDADAEDGVHR
jgi:hypothetical protein